MCRISNNDDDDNEGMILQAFHRMTLQFQERKRKT